MKRFLFVIILVALALALSSCMLIKDTTQPLISNFTKSATLLSGENIQFRANVMDTGSGVAGVTFDIDGSPLPTTETGTSLYTANWIGVYGFQKITIWAFDHAGNTATKTDTFFVKDSTPPVIQAVYPKEIAAGVQFPMSFQVYDNQSGINSYSVTVDGESALASKTINLSFSNIGTHKVTVTAVNGQGLSTTKTFDIKVIEAQKITPYVQFVNAPRILKSGQEATFTVYAYSPNGVGYVEMDLATSTKVAFANAENSYNFNLTVPKEGTQVIEATCTVVDGFGIQKVISSPVLIIGEDATSAIIIPSIVSTSDVVKIPFYAGSTLKDAHVAASVDGVPVEVEGIAPTLWALWHATPGKHVFGVSFGKTTSAEEDFSSSLPPIKVLKVTRTSSEVIVRFSDRIRFYADPIFEVTKGSTSILIQKKDVRIDGSDVYLPYSMVPNDSSVKILGLQDEYGRKIAFSFNLPYDSGNP